VKLNLGCGSHILDGWINADISLDAFALEALRADRDGEPPAATTPVLPLVHDETDTEAKLLDRRDLALPWDDDTFDQVLIAHTLEHISLEDGLYVTDKDLWTYDQWGHKVEIPTVQSVLAEVRRVLKPGGALLAVGPDHDKFLSFILNVDNDIVGEGGPYERETRWYNLGHPDKPLLKEGALKAWYRAHLDDTEGEVSPWREKGPFTARDLEMTVTSILTAVLDMVFENYPHLPHNDHMWNCSESRLLALVGEHFDSAVVVDREDYNSVRGALWNDPDDRVWPTRSWGSFNCAVLAQ